MRRYAGQVKALAELLDIPCYGISEIGYKRFTCSEMSMLWYTADAKLNSRRGGANHVRHQGKVATTKIDQYGLLPDTSKRPVGAVPGGINDVPQASVRA